MTSRPPSLAETRCASLSLRGAPLLRAVRTATRGSLRLRLGSALTRSGVAGLDTIFDAARGVAKQRSRTVYTATSVVACGVANLFCQP